MNRRQFFGATGGLLVAGLCGKRLGPDTPLMPLPPGEAVLPVTAATSGGYLVPQAFVWQITTVLDGYELDARKVAVIENVHAE